MLRFAVHQSLPFDRSKSVSYQMNGSYQRYQLPDSSGGMHTRAANQSGRSGLLYNSPTLSALTMMVVPSLYRPVFASSGRFADCSARMISQKASICPSRPILTAVSASIASLSLRFCRPVQGHRSTVLTDLSIFVLTGWNGEHAAATLTAQVVYHAAVVVQPDRAGDSLQRKVRLAAQFHDADVPRLHGLPVPNDAHAACTVNTHALPIFRYSQTS